MRIREARLRDAPAMARASVDSYRAAHRDQIPEERLMQFTYDESERNWARTLRDLERPDRHTRSIFVAEDDESHLFGVAMGGPERSNHPLYRGELYFLYLLPAYHRQGVGRQLTIRVVERLVEEGMTSLLIRVLKANAPARRFYEALGGHLVLEEQQEEGGAILEQVGYGWEDVDQLLRSRPGTRLASPDRGK
jgi:ribosomal protein S18 acetylase RimI-like enzyme